MWLEMTLCPQLIPEHHTCVWNAVLGILMSKDPEDRLAWHTVDPDNVLELRDKAESIDSRESVSDAERP